MRVGDLSVRRPDLVTYPLGEQETTLVQDEERWQFLVGFVPQQEGTLRSSGVRITYDHRDRTYVQEFPYAFSVEVVMGERDPEQAAHVEATGDTPC